MGEMRQLTAGANSDSALALDGLQSKEPSQNATNAYILRLPQEVLIAIFEILYDDSWRDSAKDVFGPLMRVHPLLCDAARIFLYRQIKCSILSQRNPALLLHRSLKERPALGAHARYLCVDFGQHGHAPKDESAALEGLEVLKSVVKLSAGVRELSIYPYGQYSAEWPVLLSTILQNTLPKLPRLESVLLHGHFDGPSIYTSEVYGYIAQAPRLQRLALTGNLGEDWHRAAGPMNPSLAGTSPITEMSLSNCYDGLPVTAQLLRLPKHLKRLECSAQAGYGYGSELRLLFQALEIHRASLEIHRDSLEYVDLSYMDDPIGQINLTPFTALKTLKMSWWSLRPETEEFSELLAKGLLGPALGELTLEFNIYEQSQPGVDALSKTCIAWIHDFGRFAARQGTKLERILIKFRPEECGMDDSFYPWDLLDAVKDDLATHGIELIFRHPYGSKEEFLKYVQGLRDEIAQWEREIEEERATNAKAERDEAAMEVAVSGLADGEESW